jgi:hypothetical protein
MVMEDALRFIKFDCERPKETDDPALAAIYEKQYKIDQELDMLHDTRNQVCLKIQELNGSWRLLRDAAELIKED